MGISIICATEKNLITKQVFLIKIIRKIFKDKIDVYINRDIKVPKIKGTNLKIIEMEKDLFDFSRYFSSLNKVKDDTSIIFAFNDTLGNGRKLNLPLIFFIISSIYCVKKNKYDICCPIDRSKKDYWICPYFFIGNLKSLKNLNWTNYQKSLKRLSKIQIQELHKWLENGWRRAQKATQKQKETKFLTLVLEKTLLVDVPNIKIRSFSRRSILRQLNSIFPF